MKRALIGLTFVLLCAATADAQSCAKCYWPPEGGVYCGSTTYDSYQECRIIQGYICELTSTCQGVSGPECPGTRPCAHTKWVCGSRLPEKARWAVATVEIRRPDRTKS
jgi:hypothetical protein